MTTPVPSRRVATPRLVWHARLGVLIVAFAAMAFRQSSGLIVPDTKLDLTADPAGFLARALHLWDPHGAFGQLQNQAYGYLFPVGPFHLVLDWAGLPEWVIQRLWWTTIFAVALVGMWLLTRVFGVADPWARLAAAAAYALSPRMISEVGITSVEVWPMAVAPWVLYPLVVADRSPRWRITRSALAFAGVGGVNAVASGAVLILPALWWATRRWDRRMLGQGVTWLGAVVLVSVWWLVPLVLLGRHSPPFLDWIEHAAITTGTASAFEALRGTTPWLGFLSGPAGPSWPAGWLYATTPVLIVGTTLVAAVGWAGAALGRLRERAFLVLAVVVGMGLVTLGHVAEGSWQSAEAIRQALDGPMAALRNTHKFELVVRIPLAIGFAHAVAVASRWIASRSGGRVLPRAMLAVVVPSLVIVVAAPGVGASMSRPEGYEAIPTHWREAATWLDTQQRPGAVYITPASSFSDLTWGSTKDEPLQALLERPFVVRDAVPLGSAGATRLLDAIEDRLSEGRRVDGLGAVLARSGVAFVLVRNEIRLDAQGSPPAVIKRALIESGFDKVAGFGPLTGVDGESESRTVDYRTPLHRQAIEIYAVSEPAGAGLVAADGPPTLVGGPENLLQLSAGLGSDASLVGADAPALASSGAAPLTVLTDGRRHRQVNVGRPTKNVSGLLAAPAAGEASRRDLGYESDPAAPRTLLGWQGVRSVRASSSASDAAASLRTGPAHSPQAAFDGDPRTRWVSGTYGIAVGEWLHVDFIAPTSVMGTMVEFSASPPVAGAPLVVRVETEAGATTATVFAGPALRVPTPPGRTTWLRLTLLEAAGAVHNGFSVAEVTIPGVRPKPTAVLPRTVTAPDAILLEEGIRGRSECLALESRFWCSPTLGLAAEEAGWRREWTTGSAGLYRAAGTVRPVDGEALERLLALPSGWAARASSRLVSAPAGRPDGAIDSDLATGWVAGTHDPAPWFEVSLPRSSVVSGLQVVKAYELPASTPVVITVGFSDGSEVTARADSSGRIAFPPKRTESLRLTFGESRLLVNVDSATGIHSFAPIGFSELVVRGAEALRVPLDPDLRTGVPCGFGPSLTVNGRTLQTSVDGRISDLLGGRSLSWSVCPSDPVATEAGKTTLEAAVSGEFAPQRLDLVSEAVGSEPDAVQVGVTRPTPAALSVAAGSRERSEILVVPQNFSTGWMARDSTGRQLEARRVNGWQQGWILPAGAATVVTAEFVPNRTYRWGLLAGAVLLLIVGAVSLTTDQRSERRSDRVRTGTRVGVVVASAVLIGVLGGVPGLVGLCLATVLHVWMRQVQGGWWRVPVVLVASLSAAAAAAMRPWPEYQVGTASWSVQTLVWLTLCLGVLAVWPGCLWLRRSRTRRISGLSRKA